MRIKVNIYNIQSIKTFESKKSEKIKVSSDELNKINENLFKGINYNLRKILIASSRKTCSTLVLS